MIALQADLGVPLNFLLVLFIQGLQCSKIYHGTRLVHLNTMVLEFQYILKYHSFSHIPWTYHKNVIHQSISPRILLKMSNHGIMVIWYCYGSTMIDFGNYLANIAPLNDIWLFSLYFFYNI